MMRADLVKATKLVKSGKTYSEAAERLGLTRNSVAGACYRAGVRVGYGGERREKFSERVAAGLRSVWAKRSKAERRRICANGVRAMLASRWAA
jgi:hypothetical protein